MKVDVLVCGGGCAGLGAALAAAREGKKVMLIERAPFAGGIISAVGLPFMDGLACWQTGRVVVKGLALEVLSRLGHGRPDAARIEDIRSSIGGLTRHGSVGLYCIDRFKIMADEMLTEAGVQVLFHAIACGVEVVQGRIATVKVACKDGLIGVEPGAVIDCTGDADVAHFAGCPMDVRAELMPMTMHFRVGNVRYQNETRSLAREALNRAVAEGKLPMFYGPGLSAGFAPDEAYVHAVRVPGDAADAFDLTRAEMQGRRDAYTMFEYWKQYVPGFEDSYFIGSGPYIGVRETRRIAGQYVLRGDDIRARKRFDDAVLTGSWYMDIHPNQTTLNNAHTDQQNAERYTPWPYDIPYGALVARGVENLWVAGRCHSADRAAAGSTRVTVTAMAMGEAAGTAAALALQARCCAAEVNGVKVREALAVKGGGPFTED